MPVHLDRRVFLAGLGVAGVGVAAAAVAVVAGWRSSRTDLEPGTPIPPATDPEAGGTVASVPPGEAVAALDAPPVALGADPFRSGVASGDPTPTSVVLWTRLLGDDLPDEVPLVWEVAATEAFDALVATDRVRLTAEDAHTVRAVPEGLTPGTAYWYRFRVGERTSPVGRTRTLPAADEPVERFRLAVSSCQRFQDGHYAAHRDLAESDVDLVVWLGDFVYESAGSSDVEGRSIEGEEATTLEGYRALYARYRGDPQLQASQAAHPWVSTWDDHEVANDYDRTVDPDRRLAAYRAWWEHTPTRLPRPDADGLRVHRSVDVGDLARICLVDARQHADDTTLLGDEQRRWLEGALDSGRRWTVLASPVLFASLTGSVGPADPILLDYAWEAHPDEQAAVAGLLAGRDSFVVSGDLHTTMVVDLPFDPPEGDRVTAAPEFMAPAISSAFPTELAALTPALPTVNPDVRHVEVANGWLLVDLTPEATTVEYRLVDDPSDADSTLTVGRRYRVAAGQPRPEEL